MQSITRRLSVWGTVVALLLLIPLVAMQFTSDVSWTLSDFVFAGVVLFGSALAYELVARKKPTTAYRAAVGIAVVTALALVWVNAAVGIIGDDNAANLLYGGVLIALAAGSTMARLEAGRMSRALFATALVHALVPVTALLIWPPPVISWAPGVFPVFVLNAFFVMLWVVSALLFRHASVLRRA